MKPSLYFAAALLVWSSVDARSAISSSSLKSAIAVVQKIGPEGQGNAEATKAWNTLSKAEASAIPTLLTAMKDANDLAANYLRSAVDAIADRELSAGRKLPKEAILKFLRDTSQSPRARRLAFELIARVAPQEAEALVPGFANDPSVELRRDAVQRLLNSAVKAQAGKEDAAAIKLFQEALSHAREEAQIKQAATELRKLGQTVDLPRHFGFLTHWQVVGPFDNADLRGFAAAYPPEKAVDLKAEYDGKNGKVRWLAHSTANDYGMVDFNKPLGEAKGVTAYAFTEFNASEARPAELRLGSKNGWKIWFNGELLFGRDEYHRGARIDQYRLPVNLKAGKNTILIKVCQNEDVKDWTKEWEFQLRVCDATGTAILAKDRLATPKATASVNANQKSN